MKHKETYINKLVNKSAHIPIVWLVHFNLVNIIVVTTILFNIKYFNVVSKSLEYFIFVYFILCLLFSLIFKYKYISFLHYFKFRNAINILIFLLIFYIFVVANFNSVSTVDDSITTYQARIHFFFQDIPFSWNSFSPYYNPILVYPMGSDNFVYWQYMITQTFNNLYIINALFFVFVGFLTFKFLVYEKKLDTLLIKFSIVAVILSPTIVSASKGVMQEGFTLFVVSSIFYYYYSPNLHNLTNNSKILILFCLIIEVLTLKPQYWIFLIILVIDFLKILIQKKSKGTLLSKIQLYVMLIVIIFITYSNLKFGFRMFIETYNIHLSDVDGDSNTFKNFYYAFLQLLTGSLFSILPLNIESFFRNYLSANYLLNENSYGFFHFPILFVFSSIIGIFYIILNFRNFKINLSWFKSAYLYLSLFLIFSIRNYSIAFHRYSIILLLLVVLISLILHYSTFLKRSSPFLWSYLNLFFVCFVFLSLLFNLNWYFSKYEQERLSIQNDRPYEHRLIDFQSSYSESDFLVVTRLVLHEQSKRKCSNIILRTDRKFPISALIKYPSCDLVILKNTSDPLINDKVMSRQFRVINF
jgi:hypothetical protein